MPHVIEPASSGRAKCRGCGEAIAKGEQRLGERLPNPYADEGEMTLWFHLRCGACKRPEVLLEALDASEAEIDDPDWLRREAALGVGHPRLARFDGVERASSGRAKCRSCRELIPKDSWRIRLVFYAEGRFEPSGFIHLVCAEPYFATRDLLGRLHHFGRTLPPTDLAELESELAPGPQPPAQKTGSGLPT